MNSGDIALAELQQADGRLKARPVMVLTVMPPFSDYMVYAKERMKRFLKLMAVFVYPVFAFDSCSNRDPTYYLDDTSQLIAAWSNDPLTLDYRNESERGGLNSQLHEIGDFRMNENVFTGKTGERFFIV